MNARVKVSLIAARSKNGIIGRDGDLPWRLADDLAFFKSKTLDHPIIMGRRTWQSLPKKPLPRRENVVLTRDCDFSAPGARVYAAFEPAMEAAKAIASSTGKNEVFIVGGGAVYTAAIEVADCLYLTDVDVTLDGDAKFPDFDEAQFDVETLQSVEASDRNQYAFEIRCLTRKQAI